MIEIEVQRNLIEKVLLLTQEKIKLFQRETRNDSVLRQLLELVKGWPKNTDSLSDELKKY